MHADFGLVVQSKLLMVRLLRLAAQEVRQLQANRPNTMPCQLRRILRVIDQRVREEAGVCKEAVMMCMTARRGSTGSHAKNSSPPHRGLLHCKRRSGSELMNLEYHDYAEVY